VGLVAVLTALASTVPSGAALVPVDSTLPRVRSGTLTIPRNQASGRVRVIVGLSLAPLARRGRLAFSSLAARRIVAEQQRAARRIRAAIPTARIGRRFQIVLNGLSVSLPAASLPTLTGLVPKVYPSLSYTLTTDHSTSVIRADVLREAVGARGDGIKIAIVDDGIDHTNPFLSPAGLSYPAGFPKGGRKWTSPKVIVARAFPGPNSGRPGHLAVDRDASFHGTHVAGIAAGNAGTCTRGGRDHPPGCGLSGVAPRAYLGNYRVFTVPTDIGHIANTPEIAAAFEFAVRDGMDVINFSGGGAEFEPANDAMVEVLRNVVAAGVVPVISAGNDRDDFGLGTIGSPGTAPDAITVAAVTNARVFAPTLSVRAADAPDTLRAIPLESAGGSRFPGSIARSPQRLIDVGSLGVDRRLCGPDEDTNDETKSPLAPGSLSGLVALVSRGHCTFASKALRARRAGAIGIVVVDNRPGTANAIPIELPIPAGMISDLDGARLNAYLATTGGTAEVTVGNAVRNVVDGRSGTVMSFSGGGPTAFDDLLKPDVSAPGGHILSSTLPEFTGGPPFAVFDGTSMSSPHVAGAAALLRQLHPGWTPQQLKSALVSTARPAWGDTARTQEAPVYLGGAGLVDLPEATKPLVFTQPTSLSFGELDVNGGSASKALLALVSDAGAGAGTWRVEVAAQTTSGASVELPPVLVVPPGGEAALTAVARARTDAEVGDNHGFVLLRKGAVMRKVPFHFYVGRPQLERLPAKRLARFQLGDTITGANRVDAYCCPSAPFGPPPDYVGTPMEQPGAETLYVTSVRRPVVNVGVSVQSSSPGSEIDPWFLGSPNERDVQGYAGTPVNVNALMFDYQVDVGAAGASFPKVQQFYVSVDSNADAFSHRPFPGRYVLRSWVNDVRPPRIRLVTKRVASGRPTVVARVLDPGSGVDPLSLVLAYRGVLVSAARYDAESGIAIFALPGSAVEIPRGPTRAVITASDFQEAKNVNTVGDDVLPNTAFRPVTITGVAGPALTWVTPAANECVARTAPLVVVASSTRRIRLVRFLVDGKQIDVDRRGAAGVYSSSWPTRLVPPGPHELTAIAVDAAGRTLSATRSARVCR
jgi:minor extracellular serine protease Vpr